LRRLAVLGALAFASLAAASEPADAPITMADPDGQDLVLEALDVRMAASGPLVLTELEMRFRNPLDRQAEGRFACVLPTDATVSRFAKEVNGKLMEGEVVERLKARRVYTEILHTLRDPALLEQDQGNRFQARVFPIPARGQVRLLLSYSMRVPMAPDGTREVTIPVRGLTKIGAFRFRGVFRTLPGEQVVAQGWLGTATKVVKDAEVVFEDKEVRKDFTPDRDLTLTFSAGKDAARRHMLRAGEYRMVTLRPDLPPPGPALNPSRWEVYVDTSASGASSLKPRLEALHALLSELEAVRPDARIRLWAFDLGVHEVGAWTAREGKAAAMVEALEARRFLGATDLAAVAKHAGVIARSPGGPRQVVLVSDAVPSMGKREPGEVAGALGEWPLESNLHVVGIGPLIDSRVAGALADKGRGRVVQVPLTTTFHAKVREAVAQLRRPVGVSFQVRADGAAWVQPDFFEDVVAGQELVAFVKGGAEAVTFEQLGGVKFTVDGPGVEAAGVEPLLERQATKAYLEHLDEAAAKADDPKETRRLRAEMLELSVSRRVLCPLTSMLVLETEADYRRFEIDRRALVDIMVVGKSGIELMKRADDSPPPTPPVRKPVIDTKTEVEKKNKDKGDLRNAATAFDDEFGEGGLPTEPGAAADPAAPPPPQERVERIRRLVERERQSSREEARPQRLAQMRESLDFEEAADESDEDGSAYFNGGGGDASGEARGGPGRSSGMGFSANELSSSDGIPRPSALRRRPPPRPSISTGATQGLVGDLAESPMPDMAPEPELQPVRPDSNRVMPGGVVRRPPVAKRKAPSWTQQATYRPNKKELARLAAQVAKEPKDRRKRNAYCWALAKAGAWEKLEAAAMDWQPFDARNPMVYEYLGLALGRRGQDDAALRAVSTTAEIAPGESGLLNRAGFLALRAEQYEMAETLFRFAIERRPEHHNNYRGLALTLWSQGRHAEAAKVYEDALGRDYHSRYENVKEVLREEAAHLLKAWLEAKTGKAKEIKALAKKLGASLSIAQDLRVTLHWETDANDVDLHVVDPHGEEVYYSHKQARSGLRLYEDLTQGLGPELTVVPRGRRLKGAYHVGVKYFAAGPMGVSRGVVVIHRPSSDALPDVSIFPFTLLPDLAGRQQDMRHVAVEE
jgi:tetratricopeptide (TPR) repeat protein